MVMVMVSVRVRVMIRVRSRVRVMAFQLHQYVDFKPYITQLCANSRKKEEVRPYHTNLERIALAAG